VTGPLPPSDELLSAMTDTTIAELEEGAERLQSAAGRLQRGQIAALASAAAAGDNAAWSALVSRFDRMLRSIARSYRLSSADVDDVVQSTWVRLYDHIDRIRDPAALGHWLATAARRESLRVLQWNLRSQLTDTSDVPEQDELDEPEAQALIAQRRAELARTLTRLSGSRATGTAPPTVADRAQQAKLLRVVADGLSTPRSQADWMKDVASDVPTEPGTDLWGGAGQRFLDELERLVGQRELDPATLERAARIVAAEQSWRDGLGVLLDADDVARLLHVEPGAVAEIAARDEMIVLHAPDGSARFPAFQFHDGRTAPALASAHRTLVTGGHLSPWSAASWARTSHPELEFRSPAQWVAEHRDEATLLLVAARDAARAAQ